MRSLSSTLLTAQKEATRIPYLRLEAANRIAGVVRLDWERLYSGTEDDYFHALTMPGDGSLIRARITLPADGRKLYRQRVANPGPSSDFSTWSYTDQYDCVVVAAASLGAEVSIFWINASQEVRRIKSTDYGASWGSPELIDYSPTTYVYGLAAAYKPNGDLAIFFADQATLYVKKHVSGSWQAKVAWDKTTGNLSGVATVYHADWNLLVSGKDTAGNFKLWSLIYGDGGDIAAGTWSPLVEIGSAPSDGEFEYHRVFLDEPDVYRCFYVEKFTGSEAYNRPFWSHSVLDTGFVDSRWREPVPFNLSSQYGLAIAHHGDYCWLSAPSGVWRAKRTVQSLDLTADVLSLRQDTLPERGQLTAELRNDDGGYAALPAPLGIGCQLEVSPGYVTVKATATLRPNAPGDETNILTQIPDSGEHWDKVDESVADGNATRIQESRAGYQRDLYQVQNPSQPMGNISAVRIYALCRCGALPDQPSLKIVCKTGSVVAESAGITVAYSLQNFALYFHEWTVNPATGVAWTGDDISNLQAGVAMRSPRGSAEEWTVCTQVYVEVDHGGGNEVSPGQTFSLEAYEYSGSAKRASLFLYARDGWRQISAWRARHQLRWNKGSAQTSVKDILAFLLARVGLKLEVISQSSVITSYCPDFVINPGDGGDAVISRLLSFVPDVLFIEGSQAYLVYPQSTNGSVYSYGQSHAIIEGRYQKAAWQLNRIQVEGYDPISQVPIVANSFSWGEIGKLYDRLGQMEDRNIDSLSKAQQRGEAHLREAEINSAGGGIVVPVNCGQQLYDVIDITDGRVGLSAEKRRVLGLSLTYDPRRGQYEQRLSLGTV